MTPTEQCYQPACTNVTRPSLRKECREVIVDSDDYDDNDDDGDGDDDDGDDDNGDDDDNDDGADDDDR